MEFWNYLTLRDYRKRFGASSLQHNDRDRFYQELFAQAKATQSEELRIQ